jgi:hypothetical protein
LPPANKDESWGQYYKTCTAVIYEFL